MRKGVAVRRYLRKNIGRPVVVQCWGVAYRGRLHHVGGDCLVLVDVQVLDEESRRPDWSAFDGEAIVPAGTVRHVQVV